MEALLIAPCGMNCKLCRAYQREKKRCEGCLGDDSAKSPSCLKCIIKNCDTIKNNKSRFCFECDKFPCLRLKNLDKRYRLKYKMSMLENLEYIKQFGMEKFLIEQEERWKCQECGGIICVHKGFCLSCNGK